MAQVTFKNNPIEVAGHFPEIGQSASNFTLVAHDLSEISLTSLHDKKIVLNIFPSIDTATCANSVRRFNEIATQHPNTIVLCISADLPFAQSRFCGAEGLEQVKTLSTFRAPDFAQAYGVRIITAPLTGLLARAVIVIEHGIVKYSELVSEITHEPNYADVLAVL